MDGQIDRQKDGWIDGWMDRQIDINVDMFVTAIELTPGGGSTVLIYTQTTHRTTQLTT